MQQTTTGEQAVAQHDRVPAGTVGRAWWRRPLVVMVIFLVLAELGARVAASRLPENTPWGFEPIDVKVAQMSRLAGTAEVVFLGDSVAQAGLNPEVLIEESAEFDSAYNAAIDGAGGRFLERWALEVVVPELQPEVVVIGLTSRSLNDNSLASRDLFSRYLESFGRADWLGEASLIDAVERRMSDLLAIVDIRAYLRNPKELVEQWGFVQSDLKQLGRLGNESFPVLPYRPRGLDTKVRQRALNDYAVGDVDLPALARLIEELRARGIGVVIVDMPVVAADYVPLHPRGPADVELYRSRLPALASDLSVTVVDGSAILEGSSHFVDFYHLNGEGAAILTQALVEAAEEAAG